ncbi:MAG: hypothetical protein KDB82_17235 [Planctomycetes bacterium]|nr:hypothetical protein [Planctomycetota bacterium]
MTTTAATGVKLLKAEVKEPVIKFLLLPKMSYKARLLLLAALVLVGLGLQAAFLSAWWGAPFLLGAVLFGWIRGFDNRLDFRSYHHGGEWKRTEIDRIRDILVQDRKMQDWDASLLDFTSPLGALCFFVAVAVVLIAAFVIGSYSPDVGWIVVLDGLLLIVLSWFNGMRAVHRKPDLVLKAKHMDAVLASLPTSMYQRADFKAQMLVEGKDEQQVPMDFKLLVEFKDSPPGFYGVQSQVVINRVQGAGYPYCYACIVAASELNMLDRIGSTHRLPAGLIKEEQRKKDVQVLVIRQHTTSTSGYHTKPGTSVSILITAVRMAEEFLKQAAKK